VLDAYPRFLRRFPTPAALAHASLGDVLRAWSGLGYNRRARDLWRAARSGSDVVPSTRPGLDALPGIGRYTAGAVACFAFGLAEPFADTNIRRVLGRLVHGHPESAMVAEAIDGELLPRRRSARWHHALMDLGATVCLARAPRCDRCPLAPSCVANARGTATIAAAPKRQAAFATSDRRVRGAILRALAPDHEGLTVATIRAAVGRRADRLTRDLVREGLLERHRGRVRLPA
jgi:A/G-specific adenine glycosylase